MELSQGQFTWRPSPGNVHVGSSPPWNNPTFRGVSSVSVRPSAHVRKVANGSMRWVCLRPLRLTKGLFKVELAGTYRRISEFHFEGFLTRLPVGARRCPGGSSRQTSSATAQQSAPVPRGRNGSTLWPFLQRWSKRSWCQMWWLGFKKVSDPSEHMYF